MALNRAIRLLRAQPRFRMEAAAAVKRYSASRSIKVRFREAALQLNNLSYNFRLIHFWTVRESARECNPTLGDSVLQINFAICYSNCKLLLYMLAEFLNQYLSSLQLFKLRM